jgi:hypothetical protein
LRHALLSLPVLLFVRDAPAHGVAHARAGVETPVAVAARDARTASWAEALPPLEVTSVHDGSSFSLRLYGPDGEVDEGARLRFEGLVSGDDRRHELEERLEQLVVKAAYHFHGAHIRVVSGWRAHAGRHTSGEALDFKLDGVHAGQLAAYLRGLPRVGVGIYTHPRTQFVHLDVREQSYHWLDASPPGVTWKERRLGDPGQAKRDASWTPESDLPL